MFRRVLVAAFCLFAGTSAAQAACLTIDWNDGYHPFVNNCNVGIDFQFTDQGSCAGWTCSGYVGSGGRFGTGGLKGNVQWYECKSPEGIGDVTARCNDNGDCVCKD